METSKNSTRQLTLDELISSQEGFPANPTQWQESDSERKTSATCGRRCCELFESVHPVGSWERTFAGLLIGMEGWYSRRCALTWKLVGTPYNRLYFQLQVSALAPTEETASGLLLTPTTREEVMDTDKFKERMEKYDNGTTIPNLATQVAGLLPTVTATTYKGGTDKARKDGRGRKDELKHLVSHQAGKPSQLSPLFVEEMMGFPKNWTASPF